MNRPALTTVGRYALELELGRGAMGVVYRGHDLSLDRTVAVKLLEPSGGPVTLEQRERFRREARVAASLRHPNVVTVHELVEDGDRLAIAMELVDGPTLEAILAREGRLSPHVAQPFAEQVLHGLAAAHDTGLVHRDIKPANLLVEASGRLKIADFGIAKMSQDSLTAHGVMFGTAGYIAPELFRGQAADQRSDLFAVGCLVYQMVTGRVAFPGDTFAAVAFATINDEPAFEPQDWSSAPGLFAMTRALLRKEPFARPESAQRALALLVATADVLTADATVMPPSQQPGEPSTHEASPSLAPARAAPELSRPGKSRTLLGAGVALSVCVTIAFTVLLLKSNSGSRTAPRAQGMTLASAADGTGPSPGTLDSADRVLALGASAPPNGADATGANGGTPSSNSSTVRPPGTRAGVDSVARVGDSLPLVDRTSLRLELDEEQQLVANGPSAIAAVWRTSSPTVATVERGLVHAIGLGSARITVELGAQRATVAVTVVDTASSRQSETVILSKVQLDSLVTDAVERGDTKALDRALKNGGSARAVSAGGVQALVSAARLGNPAIVHRLFLCGAPVKGQVAEEALRAARQARDTLMVKQLEQAANENGVARQLCGERK